MFGRYPHSGIPGFPLRLFCSQEQNSRNILRNIFLFRNIPNERALGRHVVLEISFSSPLLTSARYKKRCGMFGPKMSFFFQQLFSIQTQNEHNIPSAIFVCISYFQFSNSLSREASGSNLWCQRRFLAPPNYMKKRINPHYEHRND